MPMSGNAQYSTWVEVDLGAIKANVRWVREQAGVQVMAVVKANAYGHGALPVAQAALYAGATWCGVARIEEALALRLAGLDCPILLLGYTPPDRIGEAIAQRISLTVWDAEQIQQASTAAKEAGLSACLHLKVDTGMSRLGVRPEGALALAQELTAAPGIVFEGLFTHFARADEREKRPTQAQEHLFLGVLADLERADLRPRLVHAANSAASLSYPSARFDLLRLGIAMYGLHPSPETLLPQEFRPALAWKTVLSQVKVVPPGQGISYNHDYITSRAERIGTLPVGYADGIRRTRPNQVLVGGVRVPVVGRVCMDQMMVLLDAVPEARQGDEVVIIGVQDNDQIRAEEVALRWDTNNYEVVCSISARVPRCYQD
jgi:alanine racemase